ncbi:MAG: capsule assembly Wzi family protein [Bacteroidota bacterium]
MSDSRLIHWFRKAQNLLLAGLICFLLLVSSAIAQRELLPVDHPVYKFLLRQQMRGLIDDFHWGTLPLSRGDVARLLNALEIRRSQLSRVDIKMLQDFNTEFEYDMNKTVLKAKTFLPGFSLSSIFDNDQQKYLAAYEDSVASLFADGFGFLSYRVGNGDSIGSPYVFLGQLGFRVRGTLYDRLGFYLEASNGQRFSGDPNFARLDYRLKANTKFQEKGKYFDFSTGYLNYDVDWLRLTVGREQVLWGMGYSDRLILSDNTIPFDFGKLDLHYKSLHYSFLHGSVTGKDSLGHQLSSKYLGAHRLEIDLSSKLRVGISEMVLYSNQSVNFGFLNPFSFIASANRSADPESSSNTLLGIDFEVLPMKDLRVTGTLLVDDINFETLGPVGKDVRGNDNKFGWQGGVTWTDAFSFPNLSLTTEYTRINPFVYSHRSVANSYSHAGLPLGPLLQPNSDEWLFGFDLDVSYRIWLSGQIRLQRTGENIVDSRGVLMYNAGSDILRGDGDFVHPNVFLEGQRVNRTLLSFMLQWEPIKQYFVEIQYFHRFFNYVDSGRKLADSILWTTVRLDY